MSDVSLRNRPTFGETVSDALVMTRRELIATYRRPMLLVFAFVQPVMFLLLFRYVFGGAIATQQDDYADFLMPGILVQTAIFGSLMTGMGINEDRSKGVVDRYRSLPMARSAVLIGRTLSDALRNLGTIVVMLLVGLLVGFSPDESLPRLLLAIGMVLIFSYVFSWVSATIGLAVADPETMQSVGFIWVFPLTFASSAFVEANSMPGAVEWFADINPVTLCVDAMRALMLGGDASGDVLGTLAWSAGILLVFVPLAVWRYRRLT